MYDLRAITSDKGYWNFDNKCWDTNGLKNCHKFKEENLGRSDCIPPNEEYTMIACVWDNEE